MTPRHLGHHRPRRKCLFENPSFLVGRPTTTTARPRQHLDPTAGARVRLKLMVEHNHVPISKNQRPESASSPVVKEGGVKTPLTISPPTADCVPRPNSRWPECQWIYCWQMRMTLEPALECLYSLIETVKLNAPTLKSICATSLARMHVSPTTHHQKITLSSALL